MSRSNEDVPCDFLSYLQWRLGSDRDSTAEMLAEWLASYQPQTRRGEAAGNDKS
jgi:hypothetical protein